MLLYHGTNMVIGAVDLTKSRNRTDFGRGFYLADKIGTAQNWAARKAELHGGVPTILVYEADDDVFELPGCRFDAIPSYEWLAFICENRRKSPKSSAKREPRHEYNWVSGPIANDKIVDVIDEYLEGEITEDEAIKRARVLPQTYQLSLHTEEAVGFVNDSDVKYRQFKNGRWTKGWLKRQ